MVDAAAAVFYAQRNAPDQLTQVVRTILLSTEFRTTWGQKIKRPFEYAISLLRAAEADFVPDDSFFWLYERCGQPLFQWQPPNGFPDRKEDWSSTMPMLQRWRLCNWLIDGWRYGGDGPNKDDLRINLNAQMPVQYTTAESIVDFWALRILGRSLPPEERPDCGFHGLWAQPVQWLAGRGHCRSSALHGRPDFYGTVVSMALTPMVIIGDTRWK